MLYNHSSGLDIENVENKTVLTFFAGDMPVITYRVKDLERYQRRSTWNWSLRGVLTMITVGFYGFMIAIAAVAAFLVLGRLWGLESAYIRLSWIPLAAFDLTGAFCTKWKEREST